MRLALTCILAMSLATWMCPRLPGQAATGNIVGHVTDSSGAAVPGVDVFALNPAKGERFHTVTDEQGLYRFFYLPPATYTLTFQHSGFSTVERSNVILQANETPSIDVPLSLGSLTQKVDVSAASPLLETESATTGTVMEGKEMNTIPIMQRYTWMSMYVMPDVTSMNGFHIDGMRDRGLGYSLDGISGLQPVIGGESTNGTVSTTASAVEEVKLTSTVLPAEYGHSAGGMLSATYRSGTNTLHWEGEDRYVNNAMLHRAYFNLGNAPFTYHELASVASGPVWIPKIYNGRNKTFFMFGWSMHREKYDQSVFSSVPSPAELNGDFTFNGLGYPIYDPKTNQLVNGAWTAQPFAGNQIPKSRFDPAIVKFLSYNPWSPQNNLAGSGVVTATGPQNNYGANSVYHSFRYRYDAKVDHYFSDKNRFYVRFSEVLNRANSDPIGINWALVDGGAIPTPSNQENAVASDTHVFGPHLVNEVRLGFDHYKQSFTPPGLNGNWAQTLGIPGVSGATFPEFVDSNGAAFFGATPVGGGSYYALGNDTFQDNVTVVRGSHSLRMGYELIKTDADSLVASIPGGEYYFGGTGFPFKANTGNDFAAFLLGSVTKATFSTALANWLPRWWSNALYAQDDWVVNPRLTLNLGLRWSHESPFQTKYGQQSEFNPTATDPLTGLPGAITHPSGQLARNDWKHFQPRIGAAYRLTDKMAFRAGFALTTIDLFTTAVNQNFDEYTSNTTLQSPVGNPNPAFFLSQGPGPINFNIQANGTSPFVGTNYSSRTATYMDPNLHNAYAMNWSSSYQYQFRPDWLLELSYLGSAGVGLLEGWNMNTVPLNISNNPATLQNIYANYQKYLPFPNFGTITDWSNFGHSTFHSGTVKVQKRFAQGLTFMSFYTFAKAIDDCDNDGLCYGQTFYDRALEKAQAGFNIKNRFVAYATYELPLGKGRPFLNKGGVLDYIFGGWNLTWMQTYQTGLPATFTMAGSPYNYLAGNTGTGAGQGLRPNQILPNSQVTVPNWTIGQRFATQYENPIWNVNAFAYPAPFTLGTLGRNTIDGPHLVWSQVSGAKVFTIRERIRFQVRYDINNVFKNPNFVNPSSVVNLTSPGLFGKLTSTQGGWCCIGGQFVATLGLKLSF